jgi:metallo-beta-lactamase class B
VRVGNISVTAHYTPGHTPGATSSAWQSCEGSRCLDIVYGDSLSAVSNDTFKFTVDGKPGGIVDTFRAGITRMSTLPCDILVSTHPVASGMDERLKSRAARGIAPGAPGDPFVDVNACKAYAGRSMRGLDERVKAELGK